MDIRDYSPAPTTRAVPVGHAADPVDLRRHRGIELMQEIGIADTREHVNELNHRLIEGIDELRATVVTPRAAAAGRAGVRRLDRRRRARRRARREGIVTSSRDGNLRISAHAYNSVEDVDAVLAALARTGACSRG